MTAKKPAPATPVKPAKATAKPTPKVAAHASPAKASVKPAAKPAARPESKAPVKAGSGKTAAAPTKNTARPGAKPGAKAVVEVKGKKGGKVVPATGKKLEIVEEDLVELELDTEVEAVDEAEGKAAKVKPLRMKVSRAKERALLREVGLDETPLTEEEVAKRRQELKTLIKMG